MQKFGTSLVSNCCWKSVEEQDIALRDLLLSTSVPIEVEDDIEKLECLAIEITDEGTMNERQRSAEHVEAAAGPEQQLQPTVPSVTRRLGTTATNWEYVEALCRRQQELVAEWTRIAQNGVAESLSSGESPA
jgi:hypothetical protein